MVAGSGLLSSNCSNDDLTIDRTVPDDVVADPVHSIGGVQIQIADS